MDVFEKELRRLAQAYREGYLTARQFRAAIVPVLVNDADQWHDNSKAHYLAAVILEHPTNPANENKVYSFGKGDGDGKSV